MLSCAGIWAAERRWRSRSCAIGVRSPLTKRTQMEHERRDEEFARQLAKQEQNEAS
jgi:hypothetical protein